MSRKRVVHLLFILAILFSCLVTLVLRQSVAVAAPPNQPTNLDPSDGDTSLSPISSFTLQSSAFSDPDAGDTHAASQWQMTTTSGDYSSPVLDVTTIPWTQFSAGGGQLAATTTYYWHVRYQDNHGDWSDWSTETSFTTSQARGGNGYREKQLFPRYDDTPIAYPEFRIPILLCAASVFVLWVLSLVLRRETVVLGFLHTSPKGIRHFASFLSFVLGVFLVVVSFVAIPVGLRSNSAFYVGYADLYLHDRGLLPYGVAFLVIALILAVSASAWREHKEPNVAQRK